jgi:hypothetical protein
MNANLTVHDVVEIKVKKLNSEDKIINWIDLTFVDSKGEEFQVTAFQSRVDDIKLTVK